jgi:hypothetical protein
MADDRLLIYFSVQIYFVQIDDYQLFVGDKRLPNPS